MACQRQYRWQAPTTQNQGGWPPHEIASEVEQTEANHMTVCQALQENRVNQPRLELAGRLTVGPVVEPLARSRVDVLGDEPHSAVTQQHVTATGVQTARGSPVRQSALLFHVQVGRAVGAEDPGVDGVPREVDAHTDVMGMADFDLPDGTPGQPISGQVFFLKDVWRLP